MAKLKFSRDLMEQHLKLDTVTLNQFNLFGTPLESLTDDEVELEISANRADLFSTYGFLKAFQAYQGKNTGLQTFKVAHESKPTYKVIVDKSVKSVRPHTVCAVVNNLKLTETNLREIINLQEKLHLTIGRQRKKCAIGVYPLDKITFPVKYEARKPADITFVPLGELKPLLAQQILQKHPAGKAYAHLLEKEEKYPLFVDAKKQILSMPPIINSQETGQVTTKTNALFVECSGYDIPTLNAVLSVIVTTLAEMGGSIEAVDIQDDHKHVTPNLHPQKIKISKEAIEKTLGLTLSEKEIEKLLARMGHTYAKGTVQYSGARTDILHEIDIIEDIAIAYGYDNLTPLTPQVPGEGEESPAAKIDTKIIETLTGLGFIETSSLHFVTAEEVAHEEQKHLLEVESPRTEYAFLRPNLIIPTLRTLAHNLHAEYPQKICETGTVFTKHNDEIKETPRLVIAHSPANFTTIKQALDYLFRMLNITYTVEEAKVPGCIEGRTASIHVDNKNIGFLGEIHPKTLRDWHLKMPLALAELDLTHIYEKLKK
jgi:phenylalanyl-tRNA synthetase beta chain